MKSLRRFAPEPVQSNSNDNTCVMQAGSLANRQHSGQGYLWNLQPYLIGKDLLTLLSLSIR